MTAGPYGALPAANSKRIEPVIAERWADAYGRWIIFVLGRFSAIQLALENSTGDLS